MTPPKSVDDYIAQAPPDIQPRLEELRAAIKAAVPDAAERISYGIPFYEYKGRLTYFGLWKKHIGLHAISAPVLAQFNGELEGYVMSKGTIQLPLDQKLPVGLIKKLVKAQAKKNAEAQKTKKK